MDVQVGLYLYCLQTLRTGLLTLNKYIIKSCSVFSAFETNVASDQDLHCFLTKSAFSP